MTTAVLYLTNTRHGQMAWKNPSARHRCYHYADGLSATGNQCNVLHIDEMRPEYASQYRHIIFHRPEYDHRFRKALKKCQRGDAVLHADYDDLLFEPDLAGVSPRFLNGNSQIELVAREFENNLQALRCFKNFITSTRFLAGRIQKILPHANVCVLPNAMPRQFVVPKKSVQTNSFFTIGYFPGSHSHGHDFDSIREVLSRVLQQHEHCRLLIAGQFRAKDVAGMPRVSLQPFSDYNRYLYLLRQVDLSLAPLVDNLFNQAKSAVKLIESVSVGTRIIVSPNEDMHDHDNALVDFSITQQQWLQNINKAVLDHAAGQSDEPLVERFSIKKRLPILLEHLQCAA